jgi:hypothetical protein
MEKANHFISTGIKTQKSNRLILYGYAVFILLTPFYLWRSGLPQIADFFFILLLLYYLLNRRLKVQTLGVTKSFLITGFLFASYVLIVNLVWAQFSLETISFLHYSLFYIYNFLVAFLTISLFTDHGNKIIKVLFTATWSSLLLQLIIYLVGGRYYAYRSTTVFNNPNQLGYFALLSACIVLFASERIQISIFKVVSGLIFSLILILASVSRAAIFAFFGLVLFFMVSKGNKKFRKRFYIVFITIIILFTVIYNTTSMIQNSELIYQADRAIQRSFRTDPDDELTFRGYDRIANYPQYWVFGAGEGELMRFGSTREFHSTMGNIQVSYGAVGTILFCLIIYFALKKDKFVHWYIIGAIMFYGLTHNGIRNSLLWILLALMACGGNKLILSNSNQ